MENGNLIKTVFCIKCETPLEVLYPEKDKISEMINDGTWIKDVGGYGSRKYDMERMSFAICDKCIRNSHEEGLLFLPDAEKNNNLLNNRNYTLKLLNLNDEND